MWFCKAFQYWVFFIESTPEYSQAVVGMVYVTVRCTWYRQDDIIILLMFCTLHHQPQPGIRCICISSNILCVQGLVLFFFWGSKMGLFASPVCDLIFELVYLGRCSFLWSVWEETKNKNSFFSYDTETTKDERPNINYVCLSVPWTRCLVHDTWYLMICIQQQYSFKAKIASSHPNIVHQHVPPLRAQLFRPQASGATAPRCRARDNRVGLTWKNFLTRGRVGQAVWWRRSGVDIDALD